jgi:hypothetical protein
MSERAESTLSRKHESAEADPRAGDPPGPTDAGRGGTSLHLSRKHESAEADPRAGDPPGPTDAGRGGTSLKAPAGAVAGRFAWAVVA